MTLGASGQQTFEFVRIEKGEFGLGHLVGPQTIEGVFPLPLPKPFQFVEDRSQVGMFAVHRIGCDALLLLVDGASVGNIPRKACFTVGGKVASGEVDRQRITESVAHRQQLGLTSLTITQALPMATKPEFDQLGEVPAIGRLPLPFQPGLALIRVKHKTLERQRLTLGSKLLADPGGIGVCLIWSPLRIEFSQPFAESQFPYGHNNYLCNVYMMFFKTPIL